MITLELAEFLHDGVGIHLATCTPSLEPEGARAIAARAEAGGHHLEVFIAEVAAVRLLPHLESSRQAAVGFARPTDERACQLKGEFTGARRAEDHERDAILRQWHAFADNLEYIGIPARVMSASWATWPCIAVRLRVTDIFEQTPGAKAGEPLR